ncbi:hypothetical protein ACSTJQ_26250, partial [Vibrio parahaemolyticus]
YCSRAAIAAELTVCATANLSRLDVELDAAFKALPRTSDASTSQASAGSKTLGAVPGTPVSRTSTA